MDIHKPKPWHGLREFLKEYVIIVVGVLTALAAEQGVEWLHWRHQAEVAREAIAFDLRRIVSQAAVKDAESPCVARRLGEIAEILDQAQTTKRLPPIGAFNTPDTPGWTMNSWSGLTSGQTLAHIPNREQLLLSGVSSYLDRLHENVSAEQMEWAVLHTMTGPGRATSDAEIASLRAALGRARYLAIYQKFGSHQVPALIVQTGYLTRAQTDAAFEEGVGRGKTGHSCLPDPAAPAHSRDDFQGILAGPVQRPGDYHLPANFGVGGALSTDR